MKSATATQVKNNLGEVLDLAVREPVVVTRNGRNLAVILSWEEYERLAALEDAWWGERAQEAMERGEFLGHEESMSFLRSKLDASEP